MMKEFGISLLLALGTGLIIAAQGVINSSIGKAQGQMVMVIGVSLIQMLLALILLRVSGPLPSFTGLLNPWILISGVLGVGIMYGVSMSVGSLGAVTGVVLVMTGQIVGSALLDHFGLLGLPKSPITWQKLGSILVIAAGIYMLLKSSPSS